ALVAAGVPARSTAAAAPRTITGALPPITILPSHGVETQLNIRLARVVARDLLAELHRPARDNDRLRMWLARGGGQDPPVAVAELASRRYTLMQVGSHWAIRGPHAAPPTMPAPAPT